jgi:L-fucose isomerase-like protein
MEYLVRDRVTGKQKIIVTNSEEDALKIASEIYEDPYIYETLKRKVTVLKEKELANFVGYDGIIKEKSAQTYEKMIKYGKLIHSWYEEGLNGRFNIHQQFLYRDEYFNACVDNRGLELLYRCEPHQIFPSEFVDSEEDK